MQLDQCERKCVSCEVSPGVLKRVNSKYRGRGRADGDNVSAYFCRLAGPHGCRFTQILIGSGASAITEAYLEFAGAGGRSDRRIRRHLLKSRAGPCESGEITPGRWRPQRAEDDGGKAVVKQWVSGVCVCGGGRH